MVQLEQICKRYGKGSCCVDALREVSLRVDAGEFVSIIGPSGSGKTTLMNILGCLDRPTSGRYFLAGQPVERLQGREADRKRARQIGFIFQSFQLIPTMTALENVELPLILQGQDRLSRRKTALQALEQVGLAQRKDHRPAQLSGGQQQRIAIARVLAARPPLVLADEPTGNLDRETGLGILHLLEKLQYGGSTVIMITHDREIAARAPRILRMEAGRLFPAETSSPEGEQIR